MSEHLTRAECEQFVGDTADDCARLHVYAHLRSCSECLRRLQSAARLELSLFEVAAPGPRPARRAAVVAAIGLAAASVLLGLRAPSAGETSIAAPLRCADSADASTDASMCTALAFPTDRIVHGDE